MQLFNLFGNVVNHICYGTNWLVIDVTRVKSRKVLRLVTKSYVITSYMAEMSWQPHRTLDNSNSSYLAVDYLGKCISYLNKLMAEDFCSIIISSTNHMEICHTIWIGFSSAITTIKSTVTYMESFQLLTTYLIKNSVFLSIL